MELRRQRRALSLAFRVFVRGSTDGAQIPYIPQKLRIAKRAAPPIIKCRPEDIGISPLYLKNFLEELESDRDIAIHTLAISRFGRSFLAVAAPGYDLTIRHLTHSLCKTVTGMAIGLLIHEGKLSLDTPVYTLFPDKLPPLISSKSRQITVYHLLSMSSGAPFAEAGSVTSEDWIRAFFESPPIFTPGTDFSYNSMNTYMLSAIVERLSGCSLVEYLRPRLFDPLGIDDVVWEKCPRGITKGGWGLYLAPSDMLKLGELILNRGAYDKKQLLPASWVDMMCRRHKKTPKNLGKYSYGFQIWVAEDGKSLLCNGMLGQNIWICPENRIVLCCNSGNCELYQQGNLLPLIHRYFAQSFPTSVPRNIRQYRALRKLADSFFVGRSFTKAYHAPHHDWHGRGFPRILSTLPNTTFVAEPNNYGLLPIFVMLMQNSLSQGIRSIHMGVIDRRLYAYIREGEESYRIEIGFADYIENTVTVRGEMYLIRARGEFCDDTDGFPLFKLELIFPELPCARRIKLYYAEKKPFMILSEQPGQGILDGVLDNLSMTMARGDFWAGLLRSRMEKEWLAYRIRMSFEQKLMLGRGRKPELPPTEEKPTEASIEPLSDLLPLQKKKGQKPAPPAEERPTLASVMSIARKTALADKSEKQAPAKKAPAQKRKEAAKPIAEKPTAALPPPTAAGKAGKGLTSEKRPEAPPSAAKAKAVKASPQKKK